MADRRLCFRWGTTSTARWRVDGIAVHRLVPARRRCAALPSKRWSGGSSIRQGRAAPVLTPQTAQVVGGGSATNQGGQVKCIHWDRHGTTWLQVVQRVVQLRAVHPTGHGGFRGRPVADCRQRANGVAPALSCPSATHRSGFRTRSAGCRGPITTLAFDDRAKVFLPQRRISTTVLPGGAGPQAARRGGFHLRWNAIATTPAQPRVGRAAISSKEQRNERLYTVRAETTG